MPIRNMPARRPVNGDIVMDTSGKRYEVVDVGLKWGDVKSQEDGKLYMMQVKDMIIAPESL